ncbi:hypothetical protein CQW23_03897 [Capsicum baccatum]|uniref:O-acyltransferase n=1 Tax=Capsicum baccatum TaxID=33114 RepID=A0A2G2XDI6_CAPBA|nr:hypothetical protein CQW23_03897 [Capsicum baccatum]
MLAVWIHYTDVLSRRTKGFKPNLTDDPCEIVKPKPTDLRHLPTITTSDGGDGGTELDSSSVEAFSRSDEVTSDVRDDEPKVERKEEKRETTPFKYVYRASAQPHRMNKESSLSSAAIFKQWKLTINGVKNFKFVLFGVAFQSHAGLLNLCIVVLIAVNSRLIIENLMKRVLSINVAHDNLWTAIAVWLVNWVWLLAKFNISQDWPLLMCWCDSTFLSGVILMRFACIVGMKLVSYAHTNYDMRQLAKSVDKGEISEINYSYDVNKKSLAYFMVAPTLCYQVGSVDLSEVVVRDFIPWLNILAEILRFGDREFHKDWWNTKTIDEFLFRGNWVKRDKLSLFALVSVWFGLCQASFGRSNPSFGDKCSLYISVHEWMVRHIYFPCLRNGIPKRAMVFSLFDLFN